MIITQIRKEVVVLNDVDASFCNCGKPNLIPSEKAEKLNKDLEETYSK